MVAKLLNWLFNPAEWTRRRAESEKRAKEKYDEYERLGKEEEKFCERFWAAQYQEEEWKKLRQLFPVCPKCRSNRDVKILVYGMRTQARPQWLQVDGIFRGCPVRGAERWTCDSCHNDFFGHQTQTPPATRVD